MWYESCSALLKNKLSFLRVWSWQDSEVTKVKVKVSNSAEWRLKDLLNLLKNRKIISFNNNDKKEIFCVLLCLFSTKLDNPNLLSDNNWKYLRVRCNLSMRRVWRVGTQVLILLWKYSYSRMILYLVVWNLNYLKTLTFNHLN